MSAWSRTRWSIRIAVTFVLMAVSPDAHGQSDPADRAQDVRGRWGVHAGVLAYGTGDDLNCPTGAGFSAGAEVRTRGPWLGAAGADVLLAAPMVCTSAGQVVLHEGEWLAVSSGTMLLGAPRLRVRGGRAFEVGGPVLETSAGAGLIYSATEFRGSSRRLLNGWFGATVTLRGSFPVGLEAEYGQHQVPIRYYREGDRLEVVHQFRRWKPFFRLSLVL